MSEICGCLSLGLGWLVKFTYNAFEMRHIAWRMLGCTDLPAKICGSMKSDLAFLFYIGRSTHGQAFAEVLFQLCCEEIM